MSPLRQEIESRRVVIEMIKTLKGECINLRDPLCHLFNTGTREGFEKISKSISVPILCSDYFCGLLMVDGDYKGLILNINVKRFRLEYVIHTTDIQGMYNDCTQKYHNI